MVSRTWMKGQQWIAHEAAEQITVGVHGGRHDAVVDVNFAGHDGIVADRAGFGARGEESFGPIGTHDGERHDPPCAGDAIRDGATESAGRASPTVGSGERLNGVSEASEGVAELLHSPGYPRPATGDRNDLHDVHPATSPLQDHLHTSAGRDEAGRCR